MMLQLICLLLIMISICDGYKIFIYVPGLSNSQALFNYRLGELLADHGHDVLMYRPMINPRATKGVPKKTREYKFDSIKDPQRYLNLNAKMQGSIYNSSDIIQFSFSEIKERIAVMRESCETTLLNKELLDKLRNEKFDLAIGHMYDFCPLGLFKVLNIPTYIWMSSASLMDQMTYMIGCPSPPSYVPNVMSSFSDRMTRLERLKNSVGQVMIYLVIKYLNVLPFNALFREHFGEDFPDVETLAARSPLIFINSEEFIDFPRPILHKIIYVGGIKMSTPNKLTKLCEIFFFHEWQTIMDSSKSGAILFSFGSVANSNEMPHSWKLAFLEAFAEFPDNTFIWKYESEFEEAKKYKNVIISPWVPQTDLFGHPKLKAFITHGGYNSLLEAGFLGIPMVCIPLFGDQHSNARKAERHGIAVPVDKMKISKEVLVEAIKKVLNDKSYSANAKKLSSMIRKKPVSAETLAVGWVEFLAEHKELPNLQVTAIELPWYEYLLLDVISATIVGVLILFYVIYRVLGLYYWWCFQYKTPNKDHIKKD